MERKLSIENTLTPRWSKVILPEFDMPPSDVTIITFTESGQFKYKSGIATKSMIEGLDYTSKIVKYKHSPLDCFNDNGHFDPRKYKKYSYDLMIAKKSISSKKDD